LTGSPFIIAVVSYLLGSIPFGYLLVRIFRGQDVRQTGSGNIGATNVARTGSKRLAIATLFLDALKGYIAVILAFRLAGTDAVDPGYALLMGALAGFSALLGHMFPIWLRFKGGKGVATALGAFTALAPMAVLVSLLLFIVTVAITRYVSLASILSAIVLPFVAWWFNPPAHTITTMALIVASCLLIVIRHKDNIRRLLAGTENRFR
jgi:acyl phosphate:glycerol-3-phosphate acyltransferase